MRYATLLAITLLGSLGCATSFTGSAKVTDGAAGCERRCQDLGMELAGMVLLGEYSDGCICQKPGTKVSPTAAATAGAPGAVAVITMMREAERSSQYR